MSLLGIDNAGIAQNLKDGIAQAQAAGLVWEDHLPAIVAQAMDPEIARIELALTGLLDAAESRFSRVLNGFLDRLNGAIVEVSRGKSDDARAILGTVQATLTIPLRQL